MQQFRIGLNWTKGFDGRWGRGILVNYQSPEITLITKIIKNIQEQNFLIVKARFYKYGPNTNLPGSFISDL